MMPMGLASPNSLVADLGLAEGGADPVGGDRLPARGMQWVESLGGGAVQYLAEAPIPMG